MRILLLTACAVFCTMSFQASAAETKQICTRNSFVGIDEVADICTNICINNGFKKSQSWRCGSEIARTVCNNGSSCVCNCAIPAREEDKQDKQDKRDNGGSIDIPFGDKFKLQINP